MLKYRIKKLNLTASLLFFILFSLTKNVCAENNLNTQQLETVQGVVSDFNGIPLPGVNVLAKGTTVGVITDINGHYLINLPPKSTLLVFSFIGMKTSEVSINNQTVINVTLNEDISGLDEVIVVGYMSQKKADLTGSIALVSKSDISMSTGANILKSLQGKVPGMVITSDGNPNDNVNVTIRGLTSMRSAPPLLVIDGLPSNVNLKDINPSDIESIQVLKDAASASIYGSRAASGVILINTKLGKVGEQKISYDGSVGFSAFMYPIDMLNTQEYGQCLWQAAVNDGLDPNQNTQIYSYDWHKDAAGTAILDKITPREWLNAEQTMKSGNTNWMKEATRLGMQQNHQLSISNGTERAKTMLSINYYENQGTQIHTYLKKISTRFNSEYNLIKDILTIGENFTIAQSNTVDQNVMRYILTEPPIIPVHLVDGSGWGGTAYGLGMDDYDNPVRMLTMNKDNVDHSLKILGNMYASLKILKNLRFKTSIGLDYTNRDYRYMNQKWKEGGGKLNSINGVTQYAAKVFTTTWTNTFNYNLDLGNNQVDILAGTEAIKYSLKDIYGNRNDLLIENYDYAYLSSATGTQTVAGTGDEFTMMSYFGKVNYAYNSKYLLSATLRYDGSSKFGENNRFGLFPAVSAGWRISEEPFLKGNKIISDLKLRASWGMNGNSNIPTNALVNFYDANYSTTSYALQGNDSGSLLSGYRRIHTGNPDLKWETTTQTNIGVDFGLLNGSFSGSLDYYYKSTIGMLYQPGYLSAIGEGGAMWLNAADMKNSGVEFQLMYASDANKDFTYSIGANIATNKNTIDNLPSVARFDYGGNGLGDDILGRPLNSFYGFVTDGLFKTQEEVNNSAEQPGKGIGRIRYKDLDGDGRITTQYDRTWIGVADPVFTYGINFNSKFKNFDFYMFWQGLLGNTVKNDWKTYSDFWNIWTQNGFNHPTRILGAWTTTNQNSTIPALSMSNPNDERRLSTYYMESGSYLKLRNIEIGYTLPKNIASKLSMQSFRVYVLAQNLINLHKWWGNDKYTGVDPETPTKAGEYSNPYSIPQIFRIGVNATF